MTSETGEQFVERMTNTVWNEIPPSCRERLFDLARRGAAVQWRPISEAPKDGREVVVGREGHWSEVYHRRIEIIGDDWPWLYARPGEDLMREKPTHWMPLPPPPEGEPRDE